MWGFYLNVCEKLLEVDTLSKQRLREGKQFPRHTASEQQSHLVLGGLSPAQQDLSSRAFLERQLRATSGKEIKQSLA